MGKKYWIMLYEMFSNEEGLQEKYKELSNVVDLIMESIKLSDQTDEVNKKLQELNKEEK